MQLSPNELQVLPLAQPHSQRRWRKQELRGFGLTAGKQEGSLERGWKAEWEVFLGVLSLEVAKEGSGVVGSVLKKVRFYLIFFFFFFGVVMVGRFMGIRCNL